MKGTFFSNRICLFLLLTVLYGNVRGHKHKKSEKDVLEASQKIVDQHLKLDSRPSTESATTYKYAESLIDDFKILMATLIEDVDRQVAKKLNSPKSTKTLYKVHQVDSSTDSYGKVVSSTTSVYTNDKHTPEVSRNPISTTDSYNKVASSTKAYPKDYHTTEVPCKHRTTTQAYTESTSTTKAPCTEENPASFATAKDSYSTTPVPPSSHTARSPILVGSISGVPGLNFPDYTDIPITSFTCSDKAYLPGFYADLDTGCQVFHVCWQNRRESFLCPLGTTFNQALLACDYWYSTNCSLASHYYDVNGETSKAILTLKNSPKSMVDLLLEKSDPLVDDSKNNLKPDAVLSIISKFLPVKAKVVIYPETDGKRAKIVASTSVGNEENKSKPLKVQKHASKTSASRVMASSIGKIVHKTDYVKDELKPLKVEQPEEPIVFAKPDVYDVDSLRYDAIRTASKIFLSKLSEKLKLSMEKEGSVQSEKFPEGLRVQPLGNKLKTLDHDFKAFELATERLFSRISEMKRFYERGQSVKEPTHEYVKPTSKPAKVPDVVEKPHGLTQLNPRFIVKPFLQPTVKVSKHVKSPTEEDSEKRKLPVHDVSKSTPYSGMNIAPETKAALAENYWKYMKIRKLA